MLHIVNINNEEKRAKKATLRYATGNRKCGRITVINRDKLGPIRKVTPEPLQGLPSNTIVREFMKKYFVVYSVEGLGEVQEYTYSVRSFINRSRNFFDKRQNCVRCAVIFPSHFLSETWQKGILIKFEYEIDISEYIKLSKYFFFFNVSERKRLIP